MENIFCNWCPDRVMSRFMCQREKGTDSLLFVFVDEDSEQDAIHRGAVLESPHGAGSSPDLAEPSLDSVGGSDLPALIGVLVAEGSMSVMYA